MMTGFEGAGQIVRLIMRRDRVFLPVWVVAISALTYLSGSAMGTTFSTQAAIESYADSLAASPAAIFLSGPPIALDTLAGIVMSKVGFIGILGVSLMAIFTVVRHTRAEEEEGRVELLRSGVAGRHAPGAAAMLAIGGASLLVGIGVALAVAGAGFPATDAALYGASVGVLGVFFAALALCLGQLFTHARATSGVTLALFGVAFVVRGAGDVKDNALVWLSPIGWSQATHPLGDARWWPLLLPLVAAGCLVWVAVVLAGHRDLGAGMVAGRPGNARAPRSLAGPVGLAFRTQRAFLVGWVAGMFALAAVYGSLTQAVQQMARDNPALEKFFQTAGQGSLVDSFVATMLLILALLAAAFAVASASRLTSEESSGRLETLLATGLSRRRWMLGSLTVTLLGSAAVLFAGGLGFAASYAVSTSDAGQLARIGLEQMVYLPAVMLLAALAALLNGWASAWTKAAWAVFAVWFILGYLGALLNAPDWLVQLSPFTRTPQVPLEALSLGAPLLIALVAVVLTAAGIPGLERRDVHSV